MQQLGVLHPPPKENIISLKPPIIYANVPPYCIVIPEMRVPWSHGNIYQVLIKTWYKLHPAGIIREITRDNLPLRGDLYFLEVGGRIFFTLPF